MPHNIINLIITLNLIIIKLLILCLASTPAKQITKLTQHKPITQCNFTSKY